MIRSSTALMVFALVLGVPSVSHALTCGETITADTTLTADLAGCGLYGLVVGADNVVLDCDGHAITAETLHSAPVAGIRLVGRSGVTVKNCRVSNFIVGIDATSSSFNTFEQNTITASDYGVSLMGSPGNEVSGNAITGSKYLNVRIENSDWNTVESNTLTDSSTGTGIGLTESGSNLLSGNTLTGNRYAGVTIYGGELNVIQNSSITGNGTSASGYGIFIANSLSNAVHHNTITGNLGFGVHLGGANASSVHHNKLFSNRLDLSSDNSSGTDLTLNYFGGALTCASKARFSGLVLAQLAPYYLDAAMTDPATGQAPNCPLSCGDLVGGNPGDVITLTQNLTSCPGIGLQVVSDDIVLDCNGRSITGSASSFAGITLTGNRGVTVKNCTMSGFASGIYATSVASTTIENNSISGSRSIGVMVYGSQSSTLRNNTVTGGASTGVTVMVSSSIALVGNTISGNSGGGVSLASADDNVINRNRLLSNQAYDLSNASSDGNDFTLNYFGGPLGCADKPRFKGVALSQLVPYYLDAAMTDPPTGTVPAECPLLCGETVAGSPGEVITLTADLIGCTGTAGLEIVSNDIVLDCNGHSITGTASSFAGILVFNRSGLTIKNCTVTGFPFGLYLSGVTSSTVSGNTVTGGQKGISLSFSSGNTLTSNQACFSTSFDIYTQGSSNSGAGNICDQPDGWSDDGTSGCTHACDSDGDGFLYKDDSCPEEPGTFRGCLPCAIDVLVTGKTATSHGQQPVAGAAVAAFDWTDATSCAAQSRPADSELSCEATSECTTGADGTCEMVLFCGHDFDVLVDSPAQGQGVPRRSLEDLSDGASVTISFRAAR